MKKFVALMLAIIMLLPLESNINAADSRDTAELEDKLELLKYIDVFQSVISDYDGVVTRGSFAIYIARLLGESEIGNVEEAVFFDVSADSRTAHAVKILVERGIITGNPDGSFRPDEPITTQEAIKMILCVLGYKPYAEAKGGFPAGYITVANQIDLLPAGITFTEFTYTDAIEILYNALHTAMLDTVSVSGDNVEFRSNDEVTVLSEYHNIAFAYGVLKTANGMSAYEDWEYEKGEATVGDERYLYDGDVSHLLGRSVTVYYSDEKNNETKTALMLIENKQKNSVLRIDADDFSSFDTYSGSLKYYINDGTKERTVSFASDVRYVYNGSPITSGIQATVDGVKSGFYEAVDNDGNGKYDILFINSGRNVYVKSIDKNNYIFYGKYNTEKPVNYDSAGERNVIFRSVSGITNSSSLAVDVLVTVYESDKCLTVYINNATVTGVIENVNTTSDAYVMINGTQYEIDAGFLALSSFKPTAGTSVKCCIDRSGKIGYMEVSAGAEDWNYGYVIGASTVSSGLGSNVILKLYNPALGIVKVNVADKVKIDCETVKNVDDVLDKIRYNGAYEGTLVRYKTRYENNVQVITEIDTANLKIESGEDGRSSLQVAQPYTSTRYRRMRFGPMIAINNQSLVLAVPSDIANAEDYRYALADLNSISTDIDYEFMSYKLDPESGYDDVVICKDINTYDATVSLALIDDIAEVMHDEYVHEKLICRHGGMAKEYIVADTISLKKLGYKKGDLVRLGFNEKGEVAKIFEHYRYQNTKLASDVAEYSTGSLFNANNRIIAGYALSTNDGALKVCSDPTDPSTVTEIFPLSDATAKFSVCDEYSGGELDIRDGSYLDIDTYDTTGNPDMVVVRTQQASVYEVIIYK